MNRRNTSSKFQRGLGITGIAAAAFFSAFFVAGSSRAEEPALTLSGRWSAGPLVARWRIGEWGKACGPKPGGGNEGGSSVIIHQKGSELSITGGGRNYSTRSCYQQYPGMGIIGHSGGVRSWSTTCRTGKGDPRQATLKTRITATDDTISFEETGQYQFVIQGQNCTASSGHWRTYKLVQRAGETPPPAPEEPPEPEPLAKEEPKKQVSERCKTPGPATRLEVRPSRKLLRAGESFKFRAVVLDKAGCGVAERPSFTLVADHPGATLTKNGSIELAETAAEGEIKLRAAVGDQAVEVVVEVASTERYEALLATEGFNESGESEQAASVGIASASIGAESVVAEDSAGGRKLLFILLVAGVALALGVGGALMVSRTRRAHRKQEAEEEAAHEEAVAAHEEAKKKAEQARLEHKQKVMELQAQSRQKVCPVCGTLFTPDKQFCGKDGTQLVPVNQ